MNVNEKATCKNCLKFLGMKASNETQDSAVIMGITCCATPVGDWVQIHKQPDEHWCGMGVWKIEYKFPDNIIRQQWHEIYETDKIVERES